MCNLPEDLDFVFYHIEKCGGSSLRMYFYNLFIQKYQQCHIFIPEYSNNIKQNFILKMIPDIEKNPMFDYPNLKVILSHIRYNEFPELNVKMKISMIREPIDRVISHYYFFSYPTTRIHFIDLPESEFAYLCSYLGNHMCDCLGIIDKNRVFDEERMYRRIDEFSFIGTIETIREDIEKIHQLICAKFFTDYHVSTSDGSHDDVGRDGTVVSEANDALILHSQQLPHFNKNENKSIKDVETLMEKIRPYVTYDLILYNAVKTKNQRINS